MSALTPEQAFDESLKELLGVEGGFSDHRHYPGGKTRFGITEAVAREHGYRGAMHDLPVEKAKAIYRAAYWNRVDGDFLAETYPELAFEVFEAGVNTGPGRSVRWMQEILNAANRQGRDWDDIPADGLPGPQTRAAVNALERRRGADGLRMLAAGVDCRQFDHYFSLVQSNPAKWESFFYGWVARRVGTNIT